MKCDRCKIRQAVASITRIDEDGNAVTENLGNCDECSGELRFLDINNNATTISSQSMSELQEYLSDLIDKEATKSGAKVTKIEVSEKQLTVVEEKECLNCGLKLADYRKTMMLGCQYCYDSFETDLENQLQKYHRVTQHISTGTHSATAAFQVLTEIQDLKKELDVAVESEDYAHAAKLRDQIAEAQENLEKLNEKARLESQQPD